MSPDTSAALLAEMARAIWAGDGEAADRLGASGDLGRLRCGLQVHASTTRETLSRALAEAVPSVAAALPGENFAALAQAFIAAHPPRRADLHAWGDELPDFLAAHAADPCLVAWARLDRAWISSLFAPEADPIGPERLASVPPAEAPLARLAIHPSLRLVRLEGPWLAPWLDLAAVAQVEGGWGAGADGCHVALVRPEARVKATALSPVDYLLAEHLQLGESLLQAYEAVAAGDAAFDLQATLAGFFTDGLITDILTGSFKP